MNFRASSGYMVMLDKSALVLIFLIGKFLSSSIIQKRIIRYTTVRRFVSIFVLYNM